MGVHAEGFTFNVGDGEDPEVFTEMPLLEIPEVFSGEKSTFSRRTTADTGNTKKYGIGLEEGDEYALVCERDFANAQQDDLRTAYNTNVEINLQFVFTDGTVTETNTAPFLVKSMPVTTADPNGDGENTKQTFNVKRNGDWVTVEA